MQLYAKILEIRDSGTRIDCLAWRMRSNQDAMEFHYIHERAGYPKDGSSIMLMRLHDGLATNDPYSWGELRAGARTLPVAHDWIINHFDELEDGDVVDVQYILLETTAPKVAERFGSSPLSARAGATATRGRVNGGEMSRITHTPGPWVIDGLFDADTGVDILAVEDPARREDGVKICEVLPFDEDWTELEIANAHLISAAPELLDALHVARSRMAHFTLAESIQIDAAITKAEGRAGATPPVDASTEGK